MYRLVERHNGWTFVSATAVGEWIRLLRDEPRPLKLTQSALETLSAIAYRQPVIRSEVEDSRRIDRQRMSRLLERDLIQIVGRADLPVDPFSTGQAKPS